MILKLIDDFYYGGDIIEERISDSEDRLEEIYNEKWRIGKIEI